MDYEPFDLTLEQFEQFLRSLSESIVVGLARNPEDCPLARAYLSRHPRTGVSIGRFHADVNGWTRTLTNWQQRLVSTVDKRDEDAPITASDALALLPALRRAERHGPRPL